MPTKQRPDAGQRIVQRDGEQQPGQPLSPAPPIAVAQVDGQTAAEPVPAPAAEHQPAQRQATEQHVTEQQVAELPPVEAGYSLASTGDYRIAVIAPKRSAAKPADLVLAPPDETGKDEGAESDSRGEATARPAAGFASAAADLDPALRAARLFFSIDPMGQRLGVLEPWAPGEEPMLESADVAVNTDNVSAHANIRLAALPPSMPGQSGIMRDAPVERADLPPLPDDGAARGGQTIAPKGEVTGADKRPMTPAERLNLDGPGRAKAEKCLTEVIYFEARGEAVRGQMAVAQVVLNRAFSGKYPNTVCGVVYQNAHRHLACQFTFACDRIRDVVREPDMWERAKTIAVEMLDGKLWLPDVGKATHYHAYWVRPGWVREMTKLQKLGVHTFYRPRAWGDGGDAPEWGDAAATAELAKKLIEAAKKL